METPSQGLQTVMKWKTVVAIFFVVVAYLVSGGLVFRALEQPEESKQKIRIADDKARFLQKHNCVAPEELEELIQEIAWGPPLMSNGLNSDWRERFHTQRDKTLASL
ncbi:UNVERIFIED_CONTAM: Potassium channel subfamily K member 10 [Gekko kuhli]